MRHCLEDREIAPPLREDILAAFRPFEELADPVELRELAGEVTAIDYDAKEDPGSLRAAVKDNPFARKYQVLFDQQQAQLAGLARATAMKAEGLYNTRELRFQAEGYGALVIERRTS